MPETHERRRPWEQRRVYPAGEDFGSVAPFDFVVFVRSAVQLSRNYAVGARASRPLSASKPRAGSALLDAQNGH